MVAIENDPFGENAWGQCPPRDLDDIIQISRWSGALPQFGPLIEDRQRQVFSTGLIADGCLYRPRRYSFPTYHDLMKLEPRQSPIQSYPSVIISQPRVERSDAGETGEDQELLMFWFEKREEWLAIFHRAWKINDGSDAHDFTGPFAIDEMCGRKILQATGRLGSEFTLEEVRWMSPQRLGWSPQYEREQLTLEQLLAHGPVGYKRALCEYGRYYSKGYTAPLDDYFQALSRYREKAAVARIAWYLGEIRIEWRHWGGEPDPSHYIIPNAEVRKLTFEHLRKMGDPIKPWLRELLASPPELDYEEGPGPDYADGFRRNEERYRAIRKGLKSLLKEPRTPFHRRFFTLFQRRK